MKKDLIIGKFMEQQEAFKIVNYGCSDIFIRVKGSFSRRFLCFSIYTGRQALEG